ncbi:hypothetical protein ACFCXS_15465 [Streptomyces sp. NPDC056373]|uniref:hypothetical protein n=1 Tax=Streptomyces sp. NPDC056373 TaxID=3345798 RepID=UPI0035D99131
MSWRSNASSIIAVGLALLIAATLIGGIGLIVDRDDIMRGAILATVPAAAGVVIGAMRKQQNVTDDQLAAAHAAGYALALDHVARGLLDQHRAPAPDGTGLDDQGARNIHHLHTYRADDGRAAG